ncbi:mechanosensitive ion channel family protein [Clostridium sp. C105KSO13]|uniref:mechanosensitive ion channel family protein n=1 Tax=Clostridium sp. C105KSO13 TaxID=1776045 RepID=UPI000740880C|nr:mechanosensitive ion channel family protein [Clostridium sp. C105KSO13]CUX47216.1 Small-conductance mechanosensitive channel [Clostridium sp. C105KSO13]
MNTTLGETGITSAEEVAGEVTSEVNRITQYCQEHLPDIISFGIKVVLAFVFFFIGRLIIRWIQKLVERSLQRGKADQGVIQFISSLLKFSLYVLLVFIIATNLGVESSSVAALIASAGVAVGLALQGSLANFAGGVLILLMKPFVVGDYIIEDTQKNEGTVKEIQIFYTKLSTVDNKIIVIPNGTLANSSLTNVTARPERQVDLRVNISYQTDLKKAKSLLEDLLAGDPSVIQDEDKTVFVDSLGDYAVTLGLHAWVKTEDYWKTHCRLLEEIKLAFDKENIQMPYEQLVHMYQGTKKE